MDYKFEYSEKKDLWLRENRGVSFSDALELINQGDIISVLDSPNHHKHPDQVIYVLDIGGYCHLVPCDIDKEDPCKRTLKTIYKSRKTHNAYKRSVRGY